MTPAITITEVPMLRIIKPLFWTALFLIMLLAVDQLLVQVPPVHPAHAAISNFYQDFRARLIDLTFGDKDADKPSIEAVIEQQQAKKPPAKAATKPAAEKPAVVDKPLAADKPEAQKLQRYLYADGKGELHFADSLDDIPDEFRGQAQPMGQ